MRDYSEWTRKLADLIVGFGANVQPGQIVGITTYVGREAVTRELVRAAYGRGASYVDVQTFDNWVKRERLLGAAEDTLGYTPPWMSERLSWLSNERAARITLSGPQSQSALLGVPTERMGKDMLPWLPESSEIVNQRTTNWCIGPAPTAEWATAVYPDLSPEDAYDKLWESVAHICRLDSDDPPAAWRERMGTVKKSAQALTDRRFDSIHLHGPGTDLTVGLFPTSVWHAAEFYTVDGLEHFPNIPSEETFTTPDPMRAEGHVTATMPLDLYGQVIRGIRVEFEDGRAVKIDADENAEALRSAAARDEGATRLGELALVDGAGRIGPLETVFYDTLIDENAASHIALGSGYGLGVESEADQAQVNRSGIHVDFMIGSPQLDVDGITPAGEHVPVLRGGKWQV